MVMVWPGDLRLVGSSWGKKATVFGFGVGSTTTTSLKKYVLIFPKVQKGVPFSRDFQKDPENGPSNDLNAPKVGDILSFFGAFFDFFFILHSFHVYGGGSSNLEIRKHRKG